MLKVVQNQALAKQQQQSICHHYGKLNKEWGDVKGTSIAESYKGQIGSCGEP